MAREINAELLDTKIEKAQQDLVKAKHRYDAAAATLKDEKKISYFTCWNDDSIFNISRVWFQKK